jgi:hypothetical protein
LETNTFDFPIGAILSQLGKKIKIHPIDFCSRKFSLVKINYDIHDLKILTMVDAFEEWCHLLEGT